MTTPWISLTLALVLAPIVGGDTPSFADLSLPNPYAVAVLPAAEAPAAVPVAPEGRPAGGGGHFILSGNRWVPFVAGTLLLFATDRATERFITRNLAGSTVLQASRGVSLIGTQQSYIAAPILLYALGGSHEKKAAGKMANALVTAGLLTQGLKMVVGRRRPDESGGVGDVTGLSLRYESFPSGHTSAAFAMATVLAVEYPKYRVPLYALAIAVGASRVLQNKHFPSDVLVGAGIGGWAGWQASRGAPSIVGIRF